MPSTLKKKILESPHSPPGCAYQEQDPGVVRQQAQVRRFRRDSLPELSGPLLVPALRLPSFVKDAYRRVTSGARIIRRFKCTLCRSQFVALTGTIFDSRKIPITEWTEYLIHLFQLESIQNSSLDNMNTQSTGFYWLKKVFFLLKDYQDSTVLDGRVYLDETHIHEVPSRTVKTAGRELRGLSRNQFCVITLRSGDTAYLAVRGKGTPSSRKVLSACEGHIAYGSRLIHDGSGAHIARLRLR